MDSRSSTDSAGPNRRQVAVPDASPGPNRSQVAVPAASPGTPPPLEVRDGDYACNDNERDNVRYGDNGYGGGDDTDYDNNNNNNNDNHNNNKNRYKIKRVGNSGGDFNAAQWAVALLRLGKFAIRGSGRLELDFAFGRDKISDGRDDDDDDDNNYDFYRNGDDYGYEDFGNYKEGPYDYGDYFGYDDDAAEDYEHNDDDYYY